MKTKHYRFSNTIGLERNAVNFTLRLVEDILSQKSWFHLYILLHFYRIIFTKKFRFQSQLPVSPYVLRYSLLSLTEYHHLKTGQILIITRKSIQYKNFNSLGLETSRAGSSTSATTELTIMLGYVNLSLQASVFTSLKWRLSSVNNNKKIS